VEEKGGPMKKEKVSKEKEQKKVYEKPILTKHKKLRDITGSVHSVQ
jgi:hypothetical protein